MLIGDKYKIECDDLNFTIFQKGVSKNTGKEYWGPISYFSTLENALDEIINLGVAETGLKDFKTVIEKLGELSDLIKGLKWGQDFVESLRNREKGKGKDISRATSTKRQKQLSLLG